MVIYHYEQYFSNIIFVYLAKIPYKTTILFFWRLRKAVAFLLASFLAEE